MGHGVSEELLVVPIVISGKGTKILEPHTSKAWGGFSDKKKTQQQKQMLQNKEQDARPHEIQIRKEFNIFIYIYILSRLYLY